LSSFDVTANDLRSPSELADGRGELVDLATVRDAGTAITGTYVEVIEAVQRDALDSMATLFEQVDDESSDRLWSMKTPLSSRLSSNTRKSSS
jgi:hypothetical protein